MNFPSRSPTRPGFTLIEMLVACTIGAVVLGMAFQTFLDANKAKSTAIASGVLKAAGQVAVNDIYKGLHQSRHIFDRGPITGTFIGRLPIAGCNLTGAPDCSPGVTPGELQLPQIQLSGSFMAQDASGAAVPNFSAASVGNALLFATVEPKVILTQGTDNDLQAVFGTSTYYLTAYRLHFYFLAHRTLANNLHYRGTDNYDYQLMHWESRPYLDYKEVVLWMKGLKDYAGVPALSTSANAFITAKMTNLATSFAGALDLTSTDAGVTAPLSAVYNPVADPTYRDLTRNTSSLFKTGRFRSALHFEMRNSFGEPMVAFNTSDAPGAPLIKGVTVPNLMNPGVPAYANNPSRLPFGFETMVAGPPDSRQVLVRLALAAVTMPGKVKVGEVFQQVVQVYDY